MLTIIFLQNSLILVLFFNDTILRIICKEEKEIYEKEKDWMREKKERVREKGQDEKKENNKNQEDEWKGK